MIRGNTMYYFIEKESVKSACKFKRENGQTTLHKKFVMDGVHLSV